jgi:hypothetical protein
LGLNDNKISHISLNTFNGLSNLKCLKLFVNQITSIEDFSFQNLNKLNHLFLGFNQLNTINLNTFNGLINLIELDMRSNVINIIEYQSFQVLKRLKILDLRSSINLLEIDLNGLQHIGTIILSKTLKEKIKKKDFSNIYFI